MKKTNFFSVTAPHGLQLEYRIHLGDITTHQLNITLTIENLPQTRIFNFYQGSLKPYHLHCHNKQGQELSYQLLPEEIQIFTNGVTSFVLQYNITIGQLAKHGHQGRLTTDFLICNGENILLLPLSLASSATDEEVHKSTASIILFFDVPRDWTSIVPFGAPSLPLTSRNIQLNNPNWSAIREILKACFAFGRFTTYSPPQNPELTIYTPHTACKLQPSQSYTGICCLYDYYASLFGVKPKLALVLLGLDREDQNYIFGGAGTQTIGTTFQPEISRDWELLAHRFFHAFFESQVTSSHFHQPPQLWFYEGLATYYENVALDALPHDLKIHLGLDAQSNFAALFQRFLYFRLKHSDLLALVPMDEAQISSAGMLEFLHYTQAPLLVKFLEDTSVSEGQQRDQILKFIVKNNNQNFTVQQIIKEVLKQNPASKMHPYLYSTALLPLWYLKTTKSLDNSAICQQLNEYSYTLWSWFRLDGINYQSEHVNLSS